MSSELLLPGRVGRTDLVSVRGLRIERTDTQHGRTLVSGVDLTVAPGETVGIVGESGSGKTVTARAITGLLPSNLEATGEVVFGGRNLLELTERQWRTVRGSGIGLVLQDPFTMLNPTMRCGDIISESLSRRLPRKDRRAEGARRLAEVGIHDESVLDRYPFQLSGGMRQRIAIAAALAGDPRVLVADEPSTALDVTTQREILTLIKRIQADRNMGLVLITHDLRVAFAMCDRIHVFYAGSVVEVGSPADLDRLPFHPYTLGLLLSEPPVEHRVERLVSIPGSVPSPDEVTDSCTFAPRCHWADTSCTSRRPQLLARQAGRETACERVDEIESEMLVERRTASNEAQHPVSRRTSAPLITVTDVSKTFRGSGHVVQALDAVSLEINADESVGLVGESGSGKTTLSRLLVGLERATAGEIVIDGITVTDWGKLGRQDQRKLRRTVQTVFQDPYSSLNPAHSIGWTLTEAVSIHAPDTKNVEGRVKDLLHAVGLPEQCAAQRPSALSGGMRQRVAIARALAAGPRILICDEPVSALDVSVQAQILNLLSSIREQRGIGYLFVTHDLSIVRQICDHLYVMHRGRVVESGPTDSVLANPADPYTAKLIESMPRAESTWLGV